METLDNVKPGDQLLVTSNRGPDTIVRVEKVNPKTVTTTSGARYRKDTGRLVGAGTWDAISAQPATPDDAARVVAQVRRRRLLRELRSLATADPSGYSDEQLRAAVEALTGGK